jgi:hypothetical protein
LGGGSSWLRISHGSYTKFGGQVFPVGFGGSFAILSANNANTIEYAGQPIKFFWVQPRIEILLLVIAMLQHPFNPMLPLGPV